jgi:hypothetical protein
VAQAASLPFGISCSAWLVHLRCLQLASEVVGTTGVVDGVVEAYTGILFFSFWRLLAPDFGMAHCAYPISRYHRANSGLTLTLTTVGTFDFRVVSGFGTVLGEVALYA